MQSADGSVRLPANEATTRWPTALHEVGDGKDKHRSLDESEDWVEWQFRATQAGKMEVSAEIAAVDAGKFRLELAGQRLEGRAPATAATQNSNGLSLGTLNLSAGDATLTVRPITTGWNPAEPQVHHPHAGEVTTAVWVCSRLRSADSIVALWMIRRFGSVVETGGRRFGDRAEIKPFVCQAMPRWCW